jgi:hypothetical protein
MGVPLRPLELVVAVVVDDEEGEVVEVVEVVDDVVVVDGGPADTCRLTWVPGDTWAPAPGF